MFELCVLIVIVGLLCYLVNSLPIAQPFKTACYVAALIAIIVYAAGILGHPVAHLLK